MRWGLTMAAAALLTLLGSSAAAAAGPQQHNHGGGEQPPPACGEGDALPRLECAKAPGVTFDAKGRLWLAWALGGHLYVNHSDDLGKSFSPPVVVNRVPEPISAHGENRPKIALDGEGRLFVSWTTPLAKRFTGNVRFSRSLDGGEHFADPLTVNDNLELTSHRFDALGVNARGDIYLAWLDKRDRLQAEREGRPYPGAALYYALSVDHGATFSKNVKVGDSSCECCRVAMAMDEHQLPVVMWRNIYGDNIRDHALARFSDRTTPKAPLRVSHDNWQVEACPHHGPALSAAADGVTHMTWFDNGPESHGLFYAHLVAGDSEPSAPHPFGNYAQGASHPDVLSQGRNVYLAWLEFDGTQHSVWLQHSADGGATWEMPLRLAETAGDADYPFLLARGDSVYLSWQAQREGYRLYAVAAGR